MTNTQTIVKYLEPLNLTRYLDVSRQWWQGPHSIFNCNVSQQMPDEESGGKFFCPIIKKEVKIQMGVCREHGCERRGW